MRKPIALRDQSRLWSKKMFSLSPHSNTPKIDVYETHEKMLNIAYYQRNANQAAMRYHLTPVRMAIIKNPQTINTGEGVEKREPSCTVGGNAD